MFRSTWEDPGFHRAVLDQLHNFESNRVAYTNRGTAWRKKGDFNRAITDFGMAVQLIREGAGR